MRNSKDFFVFEMTKHPTGGSTYSVSDSARRQKLLTEGIHIEKVSVAFFDTNPYSSGNHSTSEKTPTKFRLCGLPLSVDDSAVNELLEKMEVKTKKVLYVKIHHPVTLKMTSVLN